MDKPIVQILNSLVPSLTGPLPPELLELAESLLALSRTKASSLRPDEEIARPYACANLACERLKQHLALPKIEPRPPVPPRVYQKLYKYLDSELLIGTRRSDRSSLARKKDGHVGQKDWKENSAPRKSLQYAFRSRLEGAKKVANHSEPPQWAMPVIRQLCKKLDAPAAPPHIFAGTRSIMSSIDEISEPMDLDLNLPALIIVLFILVSTRLAGTVTLPEEYLDRKDKALSVVRDMLTRHEEAITCTDTDIDRCMRQVGEHNWTQMDWFNNIRVGSDQSVEADSREEFANEAEEGLLRIAGGRPDELDSVNENYLQPGLGTMMDEKLDYLSESRRRSCERWRNEILQRISEMEAHS